MGERHPGPPGGGHEHFEGGDPAELGAVEGFLGPLVADILRTNFRVGSIYHSSVIIPRGGRNVDDLCDELIQAAGSYAGSFLLFSIHEDHIHAVHDCSWSNRSCRCAWKRAAGEEIVRGPLRRCFSTRSLTEGDWFCVMLYFSTDGRRLRYLKIGATVRRFRSGLENISGVRYRKDGCERLVDCCQRQNQDHVHEARQAAHSSGSGKRAKRDVVTRPRVHGDVIKEIEEIILNFPCTPLQNIVNSKHWLSNESLVYLRDNDKTVKNVLDAWQNKMCRWSIHDFWLFYNQPTCTPSFHAGHRSFDDVYYNLEESLEVLENLLKFQFEEDAGRVYTFLRDVYNICEMIIPKRNCMAILSPPSAGKNFFFDMIFSYYMVSGQLGMANRNNGFAFMEAVSKRILCWNEPNYEPAMIDTIKMIFAGDPYTVRVKCKPDGAIYRTPVIVMTNNPVSFLYDPAFADRIIQYTWSACPLLKEYTKKPNPLAFYVLLNKWGILPNKSD